MPRKDGQSTPGLGAGAVRTPAVAAAAIAVAKKRCAFFICILLS
jgi:hypothetical protein